MKPLTASARSAYPILPDKTIREIFLNVVEIRAFSTELLSAIASSSVVAAHLKPPATLATNLEPDSSSSRTKRETSPHPVRSVTTTGDETTLSQLQQQHLITSIPELPSPSSSIKLPPSPLRIRPLSLPPSLPSTPILVPSTLPPPNIPTPSPTLPPPTLASVLLAHAPFLSLYHPYVSNFSTSSASLARLRKEHRTFGKWLADREKEEGCKRLRLGDWMLAVVQRVPRYLLLVKVSLTVRSWNQLLVVSGSHAWRNCS